MTESISRQHFDTPMPSSQPIRTETRNQDNRIEQRALYLLADHDSSIQSIKIEGVGKDKIVASAQGNQNTDQVYIVAIESHKNKREENIRKEAEICTHLTDSDRLAASLKETAKGGIFTMDKAESDLGKFLKHDLVPQNAFRMCFDMAKGLTQLHSKGYVHDDMKLDNFLVDPKGNVFLSDFGKATKTKGPHCGNTRNGDSTGIRSKANDVYGLGLSIIHVLETLVTPPEIQEVSGENKRKDGIFAHEDRKGIERFMLNHDAFAHRMCETKGTGWKGKVTDMLCRARTAIKPAALRQHNDKAEYNAMRLYIDKLCTRLESQFTPTELDAIKKVLSGTVLASADTRMSAEDIQKVMEKISPS